MDLYRHADEVNSNEYHPLEEAELENALGNGSARAALETEFSAFVLVPSCSSHNRSLSQSATPFDDFLSCKLVFAMTVLVCLVGLVGLAGNVSTVVRFSSSKKSSFATHVRCLAVTDLFSVVILFGDSLFHFCESCFTVPHIPLASAMAYAHVAFWYLNNVAMTARHYQTFYFASDRYLAVKKPLQHVARSRKQLRITIVVVTIVLCSFLVTIPQAFRFQTFICADSGRIMTSTSRVAIMRSYSPLVTLLVQFTLPLLGSVLATALTCMVSHKQFRVTTKALQPEVRTAAPPPFCNDSDNKSEKARSVRSTRSTSTVEYWQHSVERMQRLNRSVTCLVAIFVICEMPILIYFYITVATHHKPVRQLLISLASTLSTINCSVNFLAYRSCSTKSKPSERQCIPLQKLRNVATASSALTNLDKSDRADFHRSSQLLNIDSINARKSA